MNRLNINRLKIVALITASLMLTNCASSTALWDDLPTENVKSKNDENRIKKSTAHNEVKDEQNLAKEPVNKKTVLSHKKGQIDQQFPHDNRSDRQLVNDRAVFKSYQGRGDIIIDSQNAISADIYVNGEKLNIAEPLQADTRYHYQLNKRTKNANNTFKIENVLPESAKLNITIPYSHLEYDTQKYKQSFSQVDALINDDVDNGFPGAVLVVVKNGKIIKNTAYGYSRKFADGGKALTTPVKMTTDTLFDIASNTKMFATNFALMKLVSEKKLDVSLPINYYLPNYQGDGRELRTIKDILTHYAGYAPEVKFFTKENKLGSVFFSQNEQRTKELILTEVPFVAGRSTKRMYSDTDYMLLGMVIEKITGMPLDLYTEYHSEVSNDIINKVKGINRVVLDISSKPPATIEWE